MRVLLVAASLLGASGVVFGALGAHGVDGTAEELANWNTGVMYQLLHAVAVLGVAATLRGRLARLAAWGFVVGTVMFAGALYLPPLVGETPLTRVAPWGGTLLIVAWVLVGVSALAGGSRAGAAAD